MVPQSIPPSDKGRKLPWNSWDPQRPGTPSDWSDPPAHGPSGGTKHPVGGGIIPPAVLPASENLQWAEETPVCGNKKRGSRSVTPGNPPETGRQTKKGGSRSVTLDGNPDVECGGVLLSHTLSGAVPSPCQALASGFGMGPGVSPGPWPPQIFSCTVRRWGLPACGGLGTGQRTRICRCFVLWPDNAHCRLVPFAGGRCGPTARGWNVSVAFRPLVPVGSTPRGASTSGLSTTCSAWGLQELEGSTECLSWSRLPA